MQTYSFTESVILEGNFWPRIEACYSRTWNQYDMSPHFHNRAEIMYVLKGWCNLHLFEYQLNPVTQKIVISRRWMERLGPGDFFFMDQGVLHQMEVPDSSYILNAEFRLIRDSASLMTIQSLAKSSASLSALLERRKKIIRGKDDSGFLMRAMEDAISHFSKSGTKDSALTDILMANLLLRLAENVKDHSIKGNALSYASKAADYIAAHLCEDLRIDDIAKPVGIAPAYLQRIFKQAMGMTIIEYLNQMRIDHSKPLLMYTEDPIVDIAVASGFNSRQHFFRVFHSIMGMSPQQYRQTQGSRQTKEVFIFENVDDHSYDSEGNRK